MCYYVSMSFDTNNYSMDTAEGREMWKCPGCGKRRTPIGEYCGRRNCRAKQDLEDKMDELGAKNQTGNCCGKVGIKLGKKCKSCGNIVTE